MKQYMFLSFGFEKPTPEIMGAWQAWFESMADRIVDQGGLWGGAREIAKGGTKELPLGLDSITGYLTRARTSPVGQRSQTAGLCSRGKHTSRRTPHIRRR